MSPRAPRAGQGPRPPGPAEAADPTLQVLAAIAIRRADRILVIREEDEPNRHSWVLPQGYPRRGETLADAACREAFEEVGLDVQVERLLGVYDDLGRGTPPPPVRWVTVCFLGRLVRDRAPVATREAIDSAWIDPSNVDPASMPALRPMLADLARAVRE